MVGVARMFVVGALAIGAASAAGAWVFSSCGFFDADGFAVVDALNVAFDGWEAEANACLLDGTVAAVVAVVLAVPVTSVFADSGITA
jgi:hypothetical protein